MIALTVKSADGKRNHFKCSLFYGLAVLWNVSLFPQNKQLTGLHNSVLEDRRAQLILTSMQEGQGHM